MTKHRKKGAAAEILRRYNRRQRRSINRAPRRNPCEIRSKIPTSEQAMAVGGFLPVLPPPPRYSDPHPSFILRHKITSHTFICDPATSSDLLRISTHLGVHVHQGTAFVQRVVHVAAGIQGFSIGTKYYHVYNPTSLQSRDLNLSNSKPVHRLCLAFNPQEFHLFGAK